MKVLLKKSDYEKMLAHARKEAPLEACGLIAGVDREDGVREVKKLYILTNTDHAEEHFTLDPKEQLQAVRDMRAEGLKPLGNWHSHPVSPSRPSEEDKRLAFDSKASYMILSLAEEEPVLHSFHVEDRKEVEREDLIIVE